MLIAVAVFLFCLQLSLSLTTFPSLEDIISSSHTEGNGLSHADLISLTGAATFQSAEHPDIAVPHVFCTEAKIEDGTLNSFTLRI